MNTISKRQLRDKLKDRIREGIEKIGVYQKIPYTCVSITAKFDGNTYTELGFSKVRWPDPWDERDGIDLAVKKAISAIARPIVNDLFQGHCFKKKPIVFSTFTIE